VSGSDTASKDPRGLVFAYVAKVSCFRTFAVFLWDCVVMLRPCEALRLRLTR
jgi:hypothetical protein